MGKTNTLIFDFDGTLADTLGMAIPELKKFMAGTRTIDDAMIERLRGMSARQAFKAMGIRWWQIPRIIYLGHQLVSKEIGNIKTFDGMLDVLERLRAQGLTMMIVSSNSTKNINQFLLANNMESYFEDRVYGGAGLFDKASALRKIVKKSQLDIDQCRYIGDEVRDIEAARKAGMHAVSVTWGYNNRTALEAAHPEVLVDHPKDLLRLFAPNSR